MNNILESLRKSPLANRILQCVGGAESGLGKFAVKGLYKHYELHPTEAMRKSQDFFKSNEARINNIMNILADEKSRSVYRSLIDFRMNMNHSIHPGMDLPQYFLDDIIHLTNEEVFLDVGGYDGSSSVDFIKKVNYQYKSIMIFEPDLKCIEMIKQHPSMKDVVSEYDKEAPCKSPIILVPYGAWSTNTTLKFHATGDAVSQIVSDDYCDDNTISIPVVAIDSIAACNNATYIKMDIEGAEWDALHGACNIIKECKPKLAISIYHSDEDMIRLIEYILELVPEYKVYIRHHSVGVIDTVAYFIT